jgi:hypothetical protein
MTTKNRINGEPGFDEEYQDNGGGVGRAAAHWEAAANEALDRAKEQLSTADAWLRKSTRERPFLVLGAALGIGYLLGRLVAR